MLKSLSEITLVNEEIMDIFDCVVHTVGKNPHEKSIGHGWYEYVKHKQLRSSNVVGFTISPPADILYAVVKRC